MARGGGGREGTGVLVGAGQSTSLALGGTMNHQLFILNSTRRRLKLIKLTERGVNNQQTRLFLESLHSTLNTATA